MAWCLLGTRTSATVMMKSAGWCIPTKSKCSNLLLSKRVSFNWQTPGKPKLKVILQISISKYISWVIAQAFALVISWHVLKKRLAKFPGIFSILNQHLTCCHLGQDDPGLCLSYCISETQRVNSSPRWTKWPPFSQKIFSDAFSWMKSFVFLLKFHLSLFLRVQLTITQHWFR